MNNDNISDGIRKILSPVAVIMIAVCGALLLPQVRFTLVSFTQSALQRNISELWLTKLTIMAITGILISGWFLFCFSNKLFTMPVIQNINAVKMQICLIVLFTAMLVFFAAYETLPIWNRDEQCTIFSVRLPMRELLDKTLLFSGYPPTYYTIVKLWTMLFGESVFVMRMVSVSAAVLTMVVITIFLNKEYSAKSALFFICGFFSTELVQRYGITMRHHFTAVFFAACAAVSAYYIVKSGRLRWFVFFLLSAEAGMYIHYTAGLISGIIWLALFVYILKYERAKTLKITGTAVLAAALYVPWLGALLTYLKMRAIYDGGGFTPVAAFIAIVNACDYAMIPAVLLIFAGVCVMFIKGKKSKKEKIALCGLGCFFIWFVIYGVICALSPGNLFMPYFFIIPGPLVWIFFGCSAGFFLNRRKFVFVCGVLFVTVWSSFATPVFLEKNDYDRLASVLRSETRPDDAFVFNFSPANADAEKTWPFVIAWLFPGHTAVLQEKFYDPKDQAFWIYSLADRTLADYSDLAANENGRAWLFTDEAADIPEETRFYGDFNWKGRIIKVYFTENSRALGAMLKDALKN